MSRGPGRAGAVLGVGGRQGAGIVVGHLGVCAATRPPIPFVVHAARPSPFPCSFEGEEGEDEDEGEEGAAPGAGQAAGGQQPPECKQQ